jgi:hypothetical protein
MNRSGTNNPAAKANEWLVRSIRRNRYGWTRARWSELTGLGHTTIEKIATYQTWRHVK